jgi:PPE-repeat protein
VPPALVTANRSLAATLIATNVLGQNTAAIAATETEYAEMWAQDAAAMYGYAGSSAAATTLTPFTSPPPTTNPAGQGAAVAQSVVSTGSRVINAVPQALQGLATSAAAAPAGPVTDLLSAIAPVLTLVEIPIGVTSVASSATSISTGFAGIFTNFRGFSINADRDFAAGKGPYTGYGPGGANLPNWFLNGQGSVAAPSDAATASVYAGSGQANTVGRLSVPSNWTLAAPEIRPAAYTLPITGAAAAPEIESSGNLFSNMGLAGAAGGAVGSTASVGRGGDQRIRQTANGKNPKPPQLSPNDAVTEIATELQELATRAQSLLAKLADSGLMTTEEVIKHKRRFLS